MSGIGWLIVLGSCLSGVAFCRVVYVESVGRKRAVIEQTLEYEALSREPHS